MNFDGIIYLSTKVGEKIYYTDNDLMFNYVFPTIDRSNNEICIKLNDMFSLSNGITYQELWLKLEIPINLTPFRQFQIDPQS